MKKNRTLITLLPLFALFSGCATPYKPYGIAGGYQETFLAPDLVKISFVGNGYTRHDRAQDFALLRASEITLNSGYRYFAILNERNETYTGSYTTPGSSHTTGSIYGAGNSAFFSSTTTHNPGQTFNFSFPESGLAIKMLKQKPKSIPVFDAQFLNSSLRSKYKIKPST